MNHDISEPKNHDISDLTEILVKQPPDFLLNKYPSIHVFYAFIDNKYFNSLLMGRISSFFSGEEPPIVPPDLKDVVLAVSRFQIAQYTLLFEVWEYFKPVAISQKLLPANAKPRDCLTLIMQGEYEMSYEKIYRTKKTGKKSGLRAAVTKDLAINRDAIARLRFNDVEISLTERDKEKPPLQSLLFNVAIQAGKKNGVIKEATRHAQESLTQALLAIETYCHPQNIGRKSIKKG